MASAAVDWGPFPRLANLLGRLGPNPAGWAAAAEELGGLWGLYVHDWPPSLRPARRLPVSVPFWRRMAGLMAAVFIRGGGSAHSEVAPQELAQVVIDCHRWLCLRILERLGPLFSPCWRELPEGSLELSQKAIARTLLAMTLERRGPGVAPRAGTVGRWLPPRYDPSHADPLGDHVCMHLHAELLVAVAGSRLRLRAPGGPRLRRPGGMRTAGFLQLYPRLALAGGRPAEAWRRVVDDWIAKSPLTQIVYLDVLGRIPDHRLPAALVQPRPAPAAPEPGGPAAGAGDGGGAGWRELWHSILARSLVGAILSPALAAEALVAAEEEVRRQAARASRSFSSQGRNPALEAARRTESRLRNAAHQQRFERLALLAAIFQPAALPGAWAALACLHARTLDMLVRHLLNAGSGALHRQWRSEADGQPTRVVAPGVLYGSGSAGIELFALALLGVPADRLDPPQIHDRDWRACLAATLTPALRGKAEELAAAAGLPSEAVEMLLWRWQDDDHHGVRLPFKSAHGWAPSTLVGQWRTRLLESLPAAPVAIEEE